MKSSLALGAGLLLSIACHTLQAQVADTATLQRMLVAEDARGTLADGVQPLLDGARSTDSLLRRIAVRGLGRLQRPDLGPTLVVSLNDPAPAVRAEAANALVQALAGQRRGAASTHATHLDVTAAQRALTTASDREQDPGAVDAIAEALGRLRYGDSASARMAEHTIVTKSVGRVSGGVVHGLYWLALSRRATGALRVDAVDLLRRAALNGDSLTRRSAVLALTVDGALDSAMVMTASTDTDEQVRRLALAGAAGLGADARTALVQKAIADPSPIVRIGAVGAARAGTDRPDCGPIIHATLDANEYVALTAIDALGLPCSDQASAAAALELIITHRSRARIPDHAWQAPAHALVALARIDSIGAAEYVQRSAQSRAWQERMFAATAAGQVHDENLLRRLARFDTSDNVREAAITALAHNEGRGADSVLISALRSGGYPAILAAAQGLKGTQDSRALSALIGAFQRLTGQRRENARDPRMELLKRITELGTAASAPELEPYLEDFDTLVATTVAGTLTQWTGRAVTAHPMPLPIHAEPLAATLLGREVTLRVTMAPTSGGGQFTIRLLTDEAPASVARIVRLVRGHYYDGHVFQRVEPNFVIQGGGPAASEYVGDAAFMRDELGRMSHLRGTLGISSRGRDTGDAQWFINLTDNIRLDHEYTVFGVIASGLDVAERILEDDRIARVEVVEPAPR